MDVEPDTETTPELGFVDVNIDSDLYAAAEAESVRTGIPVRLILLRWILLGQAADTNRVPPRDDLAPGVDNDKDTTDA